MKNKIMIIILACVMFTSFALGATGAVTFAKDEPTDSLNGAGKDRLIGVFITTESLDLFDFDGYFEDNADKVLSGGEIGLFDSAPYQGKLYGAIVDEAYTDPETGENVTTKKCVFDGIDGISYFVANYSDEAGTYWGSSGDDAIFDRHTGVHTTDVGDNLELKGTIYVSVATGPNQFYYNPVYQRADGEIYLMSGQGMSYSGELSAGISGNHTLKDEETVTINGKSETVYSSIEISTCYMDTPVTVSVLQLGKDGNVISREDYAAGDLPLKMTTSSDAEYIIVETLMKSVNGEETVTRELFQEEDETLSAFYCREDGICIKQSCKMVW